MLRPFAVIGFSWLGALVAALILGASSALYTAITLLALFVITLMIPKIRKAAVYSVALCSASLALISFCVYYALVLEPVENMTETETTVTAQLCDIPYERNGVCWYTFQTEAVDGDYPNSMKLMLSSSKALDMDLYDTMTATVVIYDYDDSSYGRYLHSKGILFSGYIDVYSDIIIEETTDKPFYYYILSLRQSISDKIEELLPEENANFLQAVLLGNKTVYTSSEKAEFSSAGVSHIIAVSGFHLSVLTQMLMMVSLKIFKRKSFSAVMPAVFVVLFMAVTGFSPSVMRAGIMQLIVLFSIMTYREADTLNSLGFAVFLICLFNPYAAADTGLLLSFSATLGIVVFYQRMMTYTSERIFDVYNLKKRKLRNKFKTPILSLLSIILITVSALIFSLPVSIMSFQNIAIYTVLTNLLITVPVSVIIQCAMIMLVCAFILPLVPVAHILALVCGVLSGFVLSCIHAAAALPYSVVTLDQTFVPFWILGTIIIALLLYFSKNYQEKIRFAVLASAIMLSVGLVSSYVFDIDKLYITIADVGEGTAVVLRKNNHTAVIFLSADDYSAVSDVCETDNIDYFLLDGAQSNRSAEKLIRQLDIYTIQVYNEEEAYDRLYQWIKQSENVVFSSDNSLNTVSWQELYIKSICRDGLVYVYIQTDGSTMLILPEDGDCADVPDDWLNVSLCIVSGSAENMDLIQTDTIVISSDEANEETLAELFCAYCSSVYSTCVSGDICISILD